MLNVNEFYLEAVKQILKGFPFNDTDGRARKCLKMLNRKTIVDLETKKKFP